MSLPKNSPNEPGMYWALSESHTQVGLKRPDLLVHIKGESPFLEATVYRAFERTLANGLEGISLFLGPCVMPGEDE